MPAQKKHYDFIIAGAGAAGLSLLMRLMAAGIQQQTSILLIDKAPKQHNDRTWCFWTKEKKKIKFTSEKIKKKKSIFSFLGIK